jgi:hypothetical protein
MSNPTTQQKDLLTIIYAHYSKDASVKQAIHSLLDGKIMNKSVVSHWTDILTGVMATSTICYQNSVRICSLAVNINNTDESFFITVGVLKL